MNKTIHTRKAFIIVTKNRKQVLCGKFPHERMAAVSDLSTRDAIRLFPNRPMAQEYMERNFSFINVAMLEVVEVKQSITIV